MKISLAVELVHVSASWIISAAGLTARATIAAYMSTHVLGWNFSLLVYVLILTTSRFVRTGYLADLKDVDCLEFATTECIRNYHPPTLVS